MHRPPRRDNLTRRELSVAAGDVLPYFFFGTLLDLDLLAVVSGETIHPSAVKPARLAGFRRTGVVKQRYPILVRCPGWRVDGILVAGLSRGARRRLDTYEGPNYRLVTAAVEQGERVVAAQVFMFIGFDTGLRSDRRAWSLDRWRRRWKRRALRRAARLKTRSVDA